MWITEALMSLFNIIFRKKEIIEPEGNKKEPEEQEPPVLIQVGLSDTERKIRRYRAYAYHHKKSRIRKKYLKKLLEISPEDRLAHHLKSIGMTMEEYRRMMAIRGGGNWSSGSGAGYFRTTPYYAGQRMAMPRVGMLSCSALYQHEDSRIEGGIR